MPVSSIVRNIHLWTYRTPSDIVGASSCSSPAVNSPVFTGFRFGSMPVIPGRLKYDSKSGSTWLELWR